MPQLAKSTHASITQVARQKLGHARVKIAASFDAH
jgi:hypothetical protein